MLQNIDSQNQVEKHLTVDVFLLVEETALLYLQILLETYNLAFMYRTTDS